MVGGLVVALGNLAFGVLTGPGTLKFFLGACMIAGEFRPVAPLRLGRGPGNEVRSVDRGVWK
jgi:hypothetical protein